MIDIRKGDCLEVLKGFEDGRFDLIYIDPPFNTGRKQFRRRFKFHQSKDGERRGFKGQTYHGEVVGRSSFEDSFDDFLGFLQPRMQEAYRVLAPKGSLFFHIDYREAHYCKVMLDDIFGRGSFLNEIIWAYDYGGRARNKWPAKHDNIFWYAKDPEDYTFNYDAIDRIPYMAPDMTTPEKAAMGKVPTDVWWNTIASGGERTGYATQKPLAILNRIIRVHSNRGDEVLDFFAGSGTTGEAAVRNGRRGVMVDSSADAVRVMEERFAALSPARGFLGG